MSLVEMTDVGKRTTTLGQANDSEVLPEAYSVALFAEVEGRRDFSG